MTAILKYVFYASYNTVAVFMLLGWILFLNTYFNDALLPSNWMTSYGAAMLLRVVIALVEAAIILCVVYLVNRLIGSVLFPAKTRIAFWTATLSFAIVLTVVIVSAYQIYRQGL